MPATGAGRIGGEPVAEHEDVAVESELDPELEAAWADACNGIYRVLKRGRGTVGTRAAGASLTEAQVAALESVAQLGPLPVGVIARNAGIAQPTVTRMINTLERRGVVRRTASSRDDRVVLIELTEAGRELWEAKYSLLRYWQRDSLLRFPPEQRRDVVAMLSRLVEIIEGQIAEK
jgi:DNA-binding MarR family transcriptional regulator